MTTFLKIEGKGTEPAWLVGFWNAIRINEEKGENLNPFTVFLMADKNRKGENKLSDICKIFAAAIFRFYVLVLVLHFRSQGG